MGDVDRKCLVGGPDDVKIVTARFCVLEKFVRKIKFGWMCSHLNIGIDNSGKVFSNLQENSQYGSPTRPCELF